MSLLKAQIITTIAGNGTNTYSGDGGQATAAKISSPTQLKFDTAGNLYFADEINNVIRKINTAGIITTVAGNGMIGFGGDGGQATNAQLNSPQAITFDAAGNLYISITDTYTGRVRKVNSAGIITTVAGGGTGALGDGGQATAATINPFGITFDTAGNLYIADYTNSRIRKVNTAGIISTVVGNGTIGFNGDGGQATVAALRYPFDVVFDATGNLYISDAYNHRIRKVNSAGIITTMAGTGAAGYSGNGGPATSAKLDRPIGLAFDVVGNLYISDSYNDCIRKVNIAGTITTVAGTGTSWGYSGDGGQATAAKLYNTNGVTLDASMCNLYIADFDNYRIRKVNFPVVATASSNTICAGATTTLTASNATNYTWSTGVNNDSLVVSATATTNYTVTGINDGCVSTAVSTLYVIPNPSITISGNSTICIGDNTTLTASGASNYVWSTGDTTASIFLKPTVSNTYTVVGRTGACNSATTVTVSVNNAFDFVLPNIVTPNNDGVNDFIDFGRFQFSVMQLEIYNRWGTKVFESINPTCVWKPTEDDGTYFYTIQYTINCNNEKQNKTLKGFVTVIR
ncbi:MAG: gliding motility-associated C-terminal domain-containing protein [Bacteroidia bacterium]